MSVYITALVWQYHWTHPEQAVLLALADHAHDDGTHIYPSVEYIAWKSEYSERQVQRILSDLKAKGILEPVRYQRGGRGHATEYHLHIEKGVKKSPFQKKGDITRQKGDILNVKGDTATTPQPSIESSEPKENLTRVKEWSKNHPYKRSR